MAALDKLLRLLAEKRMQALLLEPGNRPRMRKDGREADVSTSRLAGPTIHTMLEQIAPAATIAGPPAPDAAEFFYELEGQNYRFSCLRTDSGWSALVSRIETDSGKDSPVAAPAASAEASSEAHADSRPKVMTSVDELLRFMLDRGATALHLSSHQAVRLRIDDALVPVDDYAPPLPEWLDQIVGDIIPDRNRDELNARHDTDFAYELEGTARFRVNVFEDRLGIGAVLRLIPRKIPDFEELGLSEELRALTRLGKGLVLVTGPTGSGKSSTLASLVDLVNSEREGHIITIEDPIGFIHTSKRCLVNQREVGVHTASFKHALRAALREDPDVVLLGDLGDLETTALALETAETGHLVLSTLHTTSAQGTVERLIDQFPADRRPQIRVMLAEILAAVVSQALLRPREGGRVVVHEILLNTPEVAQAIRRGDIESIPELIEAGRESGMQRLDDALITLVEEKRIEPDQAYARAVDKAEFESRLAVAGLRRRAAG